MSKKKGLLIAPEIPADTFWSYKYIMKYINRKAAFPPMGLLTFAAQMPQEDWEFDLVDLNVGIPSDAVLHDKIKQADAVFAGAMNIQRNSLIQLLRGPAQATDTPWILGGPMASTYRDTILEPQTEDDQVLHDGLDFLVWGEAAPWIEPLNQALNQHPKHRTDTPTLFIPQRVLDEPSGSRKYLQDRTIFKELENVPIPRWDLIDTSNYRSMMIQTTAGCRFRCNFCDIVQFNGGFARAKDKAAVKKELQAIYDTGFRGGVFTVDDNFVSEPKAMENILEGMIEFQRQYDYPFTFFTQASIDLGKENLLYLIPLMQLAGFTAVFLGIENPDPSSLKMMNKVQNIKTDPRDTISMLQGHGMEVYAGFIFGTDIDTRSTADRIIDFIKENSIVSAMTGKLTPMPHTPLYMELKEQGRLNHLQNASNNIDDALEYQPVMGAEDMDSGYRHILVTLFNQEAIFSRVRQMLNRLDLHIFRGNNRELVTGIRLITKQGFLNFKGLLDRGYFSLLNKAYHLDKKRLGDTLERLKEWDLFGRHLANADDQQRIELDPHQVELLDANHHQIHQALVRYHCHRQLAEIDTLMGELGRAVKEGWIVGATAKSLQKGAIDYFSAKKEMLRFPGVFLVKAIELAAMGMHYRTVVDKVLARQNLAESGQIQYKKKSLEVIPVTVLSAGPLYAYRKAQHTYKPYRGPIMDLSTQQLTTEIYCNEAARCHEAWSVDPTTGNKRLLSTCSMCVPEDQYQAWRQHLGQPSSLPLALAA